MLQWGVLKLDLVMLGFLNVLLKNFIAE